MPVIVGDKNNLLSHLKKVEGKPLTFTLSGVYPERYEGMTVEPFFRLYECRYMVYWPVLSVQELQARQEQLVKEEKERAALDGMTADKVICGEQQPESDISSGWRIPVRGMMKGFTGVRRPVGSVIV